MFSKPVFPCSPILSSGRKNDGRCCFNNNNSSSSSSSNNNNNNSSSSNNNNSHYNNTNSNSFLGIRSSMHQQHQEQRQWKVFLSHLDVEVVGLLPLQVSDLE